MDLIDIINTAKKHIKPISQISEWSDMPGIYFIFLNSKKLPLKLDGPSPLLLYIGKTLSSSASRDRDTHFKSGRTGSSTLRRTIGALLKEELDIKPIPRSKSDIERNRKHFFVFDSIGEDKLTDWMKSNLSLSFYPYLKSPAEIESLETELINELVPPLNIDKNHRNPHLNILREARRECSKLAHNIKPEILPMKEGVGQGLQRQQPKTVLQGKYVAVWKKYLRSIVRQITGEFPAPMQIQLDKRLFTQVGNRKSYSFSLTIKHCKVTNNIDGSAVARDLLQVLLAYPTIKNQLMKREFTFRLSADFVFSIK